MNITVERFTDESELTKRTWQFWFKFDIGRVGFHLTYSGIYTRPSKRHKNWTRGKSYSYLQARGNDLSYKEVEIPADVEKEARDIMLQIIADVPLKEFSR